jgi:hypothetical protein
LKHYSSELCCDICKEDIYEFLSIDHKNNDGYAHRKISSNIYRDIINSGFPDDLRVLCHNCNFKYRDNLQCGKGTRGKSRLVLSNTASAISSRKQYQKPDYKDKNKQKRLKLKIDTMNHYGGCCDCCGVNDIDVLSIDHPNNDGAKHRKHLRINAGAAFYWWLKRSGYPNGYRVLCFNCNKSHGSYGYCPHDKRRENDRKNMYVNDGNIQQIEFNQTNA